MSSVPRPDILDYANYRDYLKDCLAARRAGSSGFTVRQFCLRAGLRTDNYLLRVLRGQRNLGLAAAEKFSAALGLKGREARYFRALVLSEAGTTEAERGQSLTELGAIRRQARRGTPVQDNSLFRHWYIGAILELASCPGFVVTPKNVCASLDGRVGVQEAREAIALLEERGCLKRGEDGRLKPIEVPLVSSDGRTDLLVRMNHRQTVEAALLAIDRPLDERGFFGLTLAFRKSRLPEVKERLRKLIAELNEDFANDAEADTVYRVNAHCFALGQPRNVDPVEG